tara:strand:- start:745 stop:1251 length:507 start_codon:yes stop_codon:yes gene_type:complete
MNRKHKVEDYLDVYSKLIKINPSIRISSDFIVGYPGEEQEDFEQTINLVKQIKFINSFSFVFSPRPGTKASQLTEINNTLSKERLVELQSHLFQNQVNHNKSMENKYIDVLVENKIKDQNMYFGRNKYFNSVIFDAEENDVGKIIKVNIENSNQNTLFGKNKNKMKAA